MRILLDENFPVDFAGKFEDQDVVTVHGLGWSGIRNGELLRRAHKICDVFVTLDRSLEFQQNIKALPFGVVILHSVSNRMADLTPHVDSILKAAREVAPGNAQKAGA